MHLRQVKSVSLDIGEKEQYKFPVKIPENVSTDLSLASQGGLRGALFLERKKLLMRVRVIEVGSTKDFVQTRQGGTETRILEKASYIDDNKPSSPSPTEHDITGAIGVYGGEVECTSLLANATVE